MLVFFVDDNIYIPITSIPIIFNTEELSFYPRLLGYLSSILEINKEMVIFI